jgi:hypothetical protein
MQYCSLLLNNPKAKCITNFETEVQLKDCSLKQSPYSNWGLYKTMQKDKRQNTGHRVKRRVVHATINAAYITAAKNLNCELKIPNSEQIHLRLRSHGKLCPLREQNWDVVVNQVNFVVECCLLSSYDDGSDKSELDSDRADLAPKEKAEVPKFVDLTHTHSQHDFNWHQRLSTTSLAPHLSVPFPTEDSLSAMDTQEKPDTGRKPGPNPLQSSSAKTPYLILYNFVSAVLWLAVLGRVVLLVPIVGFARVYPGVGRFTKWTQTMAVLEIIHSATGEHLASS